MKKKMTHLIKCCDIFEVDLGFKINKKDQYSTTIGGLVFIIYVIISSIFIIISFVSFVSRTSFNQNTHISNLSTAPQFNVLDPTIAFGFGLSVGGKYSKTISRFGIVEVIHVTNYKSNSSKTKTPVKLTKCTMSHFPQSTKDEFELLYLGELSCIDKTQYNSSLVIQGTFNDDVFQYFEFSIKNSLKKNSSTIGSIQALEEEFYKNDIKLTLYYLEGLIDMSNFSHPVQFNLNSMYVQLSYPFTTKVNFDLCNNTFVNDANILTESESILHYYNPINSGTFTTFLGEKRFESKYDDNNLFARIYIRSSAQITVMKRTYQKFTEFVADSTSIVAGVLIIITFIFKAYDMFRAQECVINNIMHYKQRLIRKNPNEYNRFKELFNNEQAKNDQESDYTSAKRILIKKHKIKSIHILNKELKLGEHPSPKQSGDKATNNKTNRDSPSNNNTNAITPIYLDFLSLPVKRASISTDLTEKGIQEVSMKYNIVDLIKLFGLSIGINSNIKYKEMLYEKGMNYFLTNLDIFTYFSKMREIDLIKYFLFDANEINLIHFISKPSVSNAISENYTPMYNNKREFTMTMNNIEAISDSFNQLYYKYNNKPFKDEKTHKILKQTAYEICQLIK